MLYLWLPSPQSAVERVAERVKNGGHNIPDEVVHRRYYRGIKNLLNLYIPICDNWYVVNNMSTIPEFIAQCWDGTQKIIFSNENWETIIEQTNGYSG